MMMIVLRVAFVGFAFLCWYKHSFQIHSSTRDAWKWWKMMALYFIVSWNKFHILQWIVENRWVGERWMVDDKGQDIFINIEWKLKKKKRTQARFIYIWTEHASS